MRCTYLLTLGDRCGNLLDADFFAQLLPAIKPAHVGAIVEFDLGREGLGLEVLLLLLGCCSYMLAQAAELMLEGCTWIWFESLILVPEWAGLRWTLRIICRVRWYC